MKPAPVLTATPTPYQNLHDGLVEMIRTIKVAKDVAVSAYLAVISLKAVWSMPQRPLREPVQPLSKMALIHPLRGTAARLGRHSGGGDQLPTAFHRWR